jgi:hypothetical protein
MSSPPERSPDPAVEPERRAARLVRERDCSGLQVQGGLDGAGEAGQGEFVEVAEGLTDPGPVEPGEVSDVGPAVAVHRDGEDVARVAPGEFHAQQPWSW